MFSQLFLVVPLILLTNRLDLVETAMTMKQLDQSLAMFRKSCVDKTGVNPALIDGIHRGEFPETEKELKCFTYCVAQQAGTTDKKKEVSEPKVRKQIDTLLPDELRQFAHDALTHCKDVQKQYKDHCDKTFFATKCMYEFNPGKFLFP